ncbi:hypothetical protein AJ79_05328 [Helicocarpus griseus UAMH5409]|uniref:Mid2 domain-containing protein n=1 Tax=Helicocarpus griseus UAMH5409 TaxID=1447875 RepID=A0A2B7XQF7_9EURO|nr:hypothetical protein AJ79_05328 [Helicocarpus griseus UAMH5409]
MRRSSPALLAIISLLPSLASADTCYWPNKEKSSESGLKTCNSVSSTSMCCPEDSKCHEFGLCEAPPPITEMVQELPVFLRHSCNAPSWPENGCLKVCADGELEGGIAYLTPCTVNRGSETWCCGNSTDCCGTDREIRLTENIYTKEDPLFATFTSSTPSSTQQSSSTSNPPQASSSQTNLPTASANPPPPPPSSGLSTGAKAGIGIGAALGGSAVIGFLVLFFLRRKRREEAASSAAIEKDGKGLDMGVPKHEAPNTERPHELPPTMIHEKPAQSQDIMHELPAEDVPIHEMEAR